MVENSKRVLEVELTEDEVNALEKFLKHTSSSDYRLRAEDGDEAYIMANAVQKLREAIISEKHARR